MPTSLMSSSTSEKSIQLNLHSSRALFILLSLLFIGAVVLVWVVALPLWIQSVLSITVGLLFLIRLNKIPVQAWSPIRSVDYMESMGWHLKMANGRESSAQLLGSTYINPLITIVNFHLAEQGIPWYSKRRSLVLLKDSFVGEDPAEQFRRLRVLLYSHPAQAQKNFWG